MNFLMELLHTIVFYGFSSDDLISVRPKIIDDNIRYARVWAVIASFYWLFCIYMSFGEPAYAQCRNIYICALVLCVVSWFVSTFFVRVFRFVSLIAGLLLEIAILGAGVFIACELAPKTILVFASVLIVPVMFVDTWVPSVLLLLCSIFLFAFAGRGLDAETYSWVLSNQVIFSTIGTALAYFVNKSRFERYVFAESVTALAELQSKYAYYDQLTGLKNRRAYEEKINSIRVNRSSDYCVVMIDINGLKEVNDTFGHGVGDDLIVGTAECISKTFSCVDSIYRIGGDEFCIIAVGTKEYVDARLRALDVVTCAWHDDNINGISLSYGSVFVDDFDSIDVAIISADKSMYESKREYYQKYEHDRRVKHYAHLDEDDKGYIGSVIEHIEERDHSGAVV